MIRVRMMSLLLVISVTGLSGCDSKELIPEEIRSLKPNEEGIALAFATTWVPNIVQAITDNVGILVEASKVAERSGQDDLGLALECENLGEDETRCMIELASSQLRVQAEDFMFGLVGGVAFLRRGCTSMPCEEPTTKIWWRTLKETTSDGRDAFTLEVCNIEGLEVGLGFSGPLKTIGSALGKFVKGLELKGMRIKAESYRDVSIQYDAYGVPLRDQDGDYIASYKTAYKTTSVHVGAASIGGFPNRNCNLENPRIMSERDEDEFKDDVNAEDQGGLIPEFTYDKISGEAVRFAVDTTRYISDDAESELLGLSLFCKSFDTQDSCRLAYNGPDLTIPIPQYITGVIDAKVVVNRQCGNLGCQAAERAVARLAIYNDGPLKVLELCEIKGIEASSLNTFPLQEKLFGMPDINGLKIAIAPFGRDDKGPLLDEFRLGISRFGDYPSGNCMIL